MASADAKSLKNCSGTESSAAVVDTITRGRQNLVAVGERLVDSGLAK